MKETEILEYTLLKHDYLIDVNMNNYEIIEFKQQENMVLLIDSAEINNNINCF